jgi:ribosomal protein L11 methyltransferase
MPTFLKDTERSGVFAMDFEVTIEGPSPVITKLCIELGEFSPRVESTPWRQISPHEQERITLLLKANGEQVDKDLFRISQTVAHMERDFPLNERLNMRVRNLAYSEPYTGSHDFLKPFSPVPSITIQPWSPSLPEIIPPRTVVLDPHHAFGTGKHPTTHLCLKAMERLLTDRSEQYRMVLDFGCGTGLLAIAAALMGAQRALGIEIDFQSAQTAQKNIRLNRLEDRVEIRQGSWEVVNEKYDLIFANLVISALLRAGKPLPGHLNQKGVAVVSGFGENQMPDLETFFEEQGMAVSERFSLKGWGAFLFRKKGA